MYMNPWPTFTSNSASSRHGSAFGMRVDMHSVGEWDPGLPGTRQTRPAGYALPCAPARTELGCWHAGMLVDARRALAYTQRLRQCILGPDAESDTSGTSLLQLSGRIRGGVWGRRLGMRSDDGPAIGVCWYARGKHEKTIARWSVTRPTISASTFSCPTAAGADDADAAGR